MERPHFRSEGVKLCEVGTVAGHAEFADGEIAAALDNGVPSQRQPRQQAR